MSNNNYFPSPARSYYSDVQPQPSPSFTGGLRYAPTPPTRNHAGYYPPQPLPPPNDGLSVASSMPSTVGGENVVTVSLPKFLEEDQTVNIKLVEATKVDIDNRIVTNVLGLAPCIENFDTTVDQTSGQSISKFFESFHKSYLNDLGEDILRRHSFNDFKGRNQLQNEFLSEKHRYVQYLEHLETRSRRFKEKNEKVVKQFDNNPQLLELRAIAAKRVKDVGDLARLLHQRIEALKEFESWMSDFMNGNSPDPEHQKTLLVVQALQRCFTFPGNVTVESMLEHVLKEKLEEFADQLKEVAKDYAEKKFDNFTELCAALRGILEPFIKIRDECFEDDDDATLQSYYFLVYKEISIHRAKIKPLIDGMIAAGKEIGLVHTNVELYKLDHRSRMKSYHWYKYFLLVAFGYHKDLEGILETESLGGKKAVLAHLAQASQGKWFVFQGAQTEQNQAVGMPDEDMDNTDDEL